MEQNEETIKKLEIIKNEINSELIEIETKITNIKNLLSAVRSDNYNIDSISANYATKVEFRSQEAKETVNAFFKKNINPLIKRNFNIIKDYSTKQYLNDNLLTEEEKINLPFNFDNLKKFTNKIKKEINTYIINLNKILNKNFIDSLDKAAINFFTKNIVTTFIKSMIINPVEKQNKGDFYVQINKLDQHISQFINYLKKTKNFIKNTIIKNELFIKQEYLNLENLDKKEWKDNYFNQIKNITANNLFKSYKNIEKTAIKTKNKLNKNFEDFFLNETKNNNETLSKINNDLETLQKSISKNIVKIKDDWNNWEFNKNVESCSYEKNEEIKKYDNFYIITKNISLKRLELLESEIIKSYDNHNFEISFLPQGQLSLISLTKLVDNNINFLNNQKNTNNLPNFLQIFKIINPKSNPQTTLNDTIKNFNFKAFKNWKEEKNELNICQLSLNINQKEYIYIHQWQNQYLPYFSKLIATHYYEIIEDYHNFCVQPFIEKTKIIITNKNSFSLKVINENIKTEINHFSQKTLSTIEILITNLKNLITRTNIKNCFTEEQIKKIRNTQLFLYSDLTDKWISLKNIYSRNKKLNEIINNNFNPNQYYYNFKINFENALFFGENAINFLTDFSYFGEIIKTNNTTELTNNNYDYNSILKWNNNEEILNICNLKKINITENIGSKTILKFLTTKTKKNIFKWQKNILDFTILIKEEHFIKHIKNLKTSFIFLQNQINDFFLLKEKNIEYNNIDVLIKNKINSIIKNINQLSNENNKIWTKWNTDIITDNCYNPQINLLSQANQNIYYFFSYFSEKNKFFIASLKIYKNSINWLIKADDENFEKELETINQFNYFLNGTIDEFLFFEKNAFKFENEFEVNNTKNIISFLYNQNFQKWRNNEKLTTICEINNLTENQEQLFLEEYKEWLTYDNFKEIISDMSFENKNSVNSLKKEIYFLTPKHPTINQISTNNAIANSSSNNHLDSTNNILSFCILIQLLIWLIKKWTRS